MMRSKGPSRIGGRMCGSRSRPVCGAVLSLLILVVLLSGCLEVRPPDRDPDLVLQGERGHPFAADPDHTFVLPEGTTKVTACFDFDHADVTFMLGPYGELQSFSVYPNRTAPFCVHKRDHLEHRDWHVDVWAPDEGHHRVRLWWR